jgi:hypothetical protein
MGLWEEGLSELPAPAGDQDVRCDSVQGRGTRGSRRIERWQRRQPKGYNHGGALVGDNFQAK